ncbi:bromodomain and WD repeat-containing protein 1-like isoform X2 [Alosa sapidissima]|uniref:bromodomain and WD repeat-containing protein 1-like isoform X2 n=1 Tax=Alosa sapidissima TaxID=34773 RepID=UPI001C0810BB|nr:bromodomain and WD repeat-containing protein 1-like isoform X2 [Alosa sapidissima]
MEYSNNVTEPGAEPAPTLGPQAWKKQCRRLLDDIVESEDSKPFRQPVKQDSVSYNAEAFDPPMDFGTVRCTLEQDGYENPIELCKDVQLIFVYAKAYSPNKRTKMNRISVRLSAFFEERIREIVSDYKAAVKSSETLHDSQAFHKRQQCQEPPTPNHGSTKWALLPEERVQSSRQTKPECIGIDLYNALENIVEKIDTFLAQKATSNDLNAEVPGTSCGPGLRQLGVEPEPIPAPEAWKKQCRRLLEDILESEDSMHFRQTANQDSDTDDDIFDPPGDFVTVRRTLEQDEYKNPIELYKDVQLIFGYAKAYCPNKRSKMYKTTMRLSELFEEHIWNIISDYRTAVKSTTSNQKRPALKAPEKVVVKSSTKSTSAKVTAAERNCTRTRRRHGQRRSPTPKSSSDDEEQVSLILESETEVSLSDWDDLSPLCQQHVRRDKWWSSQPTRLKVGNCLRRESKSEVSQSDWDDISPLCQQNVWRDRPRSCGPTRIQMGNHLQRVKSEHEEMASGGERSEGRMESGVTNGSHQPIKKCVSKGRNESTRCTSWRHNKCKEAAREGKHLFCRKLQRRPPPKKKYALDDSEGDLEGCHSRSGKGLIGDQRHGAKQKRAIASESDQRRCGKKQKARELSETGSDREEFHARKTKKVAPSRGSLREHIGRFLFEGEKKTKTRLGQRGSYRSQKYICSSCEGDDEEEEVRSKTRLKANHMSQKLSQKCGSSSPTEEEEEEEEEKEVEEEEEVGSKSRLGLTLQGSEKEEEEK